MKKAISFFISLSIFLQIGVEMYAQKAIDQSVVEKLCQRIIENDKEAMKEAETMLAEFDSYTLSEKLASFQERMDAAVSGVEDAFYFDMKNIGRVGKRFVKVSLKKQNDGSYYLPAIKAGAYPRFSAPHEDYNEGVKECLSSPVYEAAYYFYKNKIVIKIDEKVQTACQFDEKNGNAPLKPADAASEEFGCKAGTHSWNGKIITASNAYESSFTNTCTHNVRQTPRITIIGGDYSGGERIVNQTVSGRGKVANGDPYAPWRISHSMKVTYLFDNAAKKANMPVRDFIMNLLAEDIDAFVTNLNEDKEILHELPTIAKGCMLYAYKKLLNISDSEIAAISGKEQIANEKFKESLKRKIQEAIQTAKDNETARRDSLISAVKQQTPFNVDRIQLIDLGLSVLWADRNIGAKDEYEAGFKYAWGETVPKEVFSPNNYAHLIRTSEVEVPVSKSKLVNGIMTTVTERETVTKYELANIGVLISGTEYDPSFLLSDGKMRLPTQSEFEELYFKCKWKKDKKKQVYVVTGPNGNSITIPLDIQLWTGEEDLTQSELKKDAVEKDGCRSYSFKTKHKRSYPEYKYFSGFIRAICTKE